LSIDHSRASTTSDELRATDLRSSSLAEPVASDANVSAPISSSFEPRRVPPRGVPARFFQARANFFVEPTSASVSSARRFDRFSPATTEGIRMTIAAPPGLSKKAEAWREEILTEWPDLETDPAGRELLDRAAETIDRLDTARDILREAGPVYVDRLGEPRQHPSVNQVRDATILLTRLLRELRLDPDDESRPPRHRP
jgi:phage terminase small subunit